MAESGQAYREAVHELMALLYADTPLDVIEQKACECARKTLDAECAYLGVAQNGSTAVEASDCANGTSSAFDPTPMFDAAVASRESQLRNGIAASVTVPIVYGDAVVGAFSACDSRRPNFAEMDADALTAFGQYVALARSNHAKVRLWVRRLNWERRAIWLLVLLTLAVLAALGAYGWFSARADEQRLNANALAAADVSADHFDRFVAGAMQLATSLAAMAPSVRGDRAGTEHLLTHLLGSTPSNVIYGMGVWYRPYAFSPGLRLYGPYAHRTAQGTITLTYFWSRVTYNYVTHAWYRIGLAARDQTLVTPAYFDVDQVYVSAVHDIHLGARSLGVVSVDSTSSAISTFLTRISAPSHFVYLITPSDRIVAFPHEAQLLRFARTRHAAKTLLDVTAADADAFIAARYPGTRIVSRTRGFQTPLVVINAWTPAALGAGPSRTPLLAGAGAVICLLALASIVAIRRARMQGLAALDLDRERSRLALEIDTRVNAENALRKVADVDALTGVANRAAFIAAVNESIQSAKNRANEDSLVFIDLNGFERVNDTFGHIAGDDVLAQFGALLRRCCRDGDLPARLGGDEFAVLIRGGKADTARAFADRLHREMATALQTGGQPVYLDAGVGVAEISSDYASAEEVIRDADYAMYNAKRSDTAIVTFDPGLRESAGRQRELQAALRGAIERGELFVEYQPIYRLADRTLAGFEALVRWNRDGGTVMYPSEFIPLAERTEIVLKIDRHVAEVACGEMSRWQRVRPGLNLALNVSALHFERRGALGELVTILRRHALQPNTLHLELTESALMGLPHEASAAVSELRTQGLQLHLDDFGTGYSSLMYLQHLQVDAMKIDRTFVDAMLRDERAMEIVNAIVQLARSLHVNVIAEGVVTQEQANALRDLGAIMAQGFLYSPAVPASEVERLIA